MGFDEKVYQFCSRIPRGRVSTYGEIARAIGKPGSARAVGQALKRNPHAPKVPCHRVVKSDSLVGNYNKGIDEKIRLLRLEGIHISKYEKIENFKKYLFRFK